MKPKPLEKTVQLGIALLDHALAASAFLLIRRIERDTNTLRDHMLLILPLRIPYQS